MPSYTVPISGDNGPGFMTVNASSPEEAARNANVGGNYATGLAQEGGHQAHTGAGGEAVPGYPSGYGPTGQVGTPTGTGTGDVNQLGAVIDQIKQAIAKGDDKALAESIRQFDLYYGLDMSKFQEGVRQFNENLAIAQSGLTGTFQGAPTMQAQAQWAQLYGQNAPPAPGQQTLAANQQAYGQQLGAITTAAGLQANPFRQAQVMGQLGGLLRGNPVAGFQAPGQAQGQTDFSGMGNMQRLIDDIRGGPGAINSQSTQSVLDAMPTPAKLDSVNFYRSSPGTQNIVLQGMQEKYGLSPDEALAQIKNTLPQFTSPTTFGGVRR